MDMKVNNQNALMARAKFKLHGPEEEFDPRITAHRGDLADIALAGKMFAPHYAQPVAYRCTAPAASVHARAGRQHEALSQIIFGETFHVLDLSGKWAWGFCEHDDYVGYVACDGLAPLHSLGTPTHNVIAPAALIFAEADIKSMIVRRLPMGAKLISESVSECGNFLKLADGFVHHHHVGAVDSPVDDITGLAEKLIGSPYIWGGRSGDGLDCSGLIQMVLGLGAMVAPRDSDQQQLVLGEDIAADGSLQRGDLVFFPEHVGIMADEENLIHANAFWMQVVKEPLAEVIERFGDTEQTPVLARKRLL